MDRGTPVEQGGLFILSAPSGAGKSTLIRRLFADHPDLAARIAFCVSHASRPPRVGEVDGRDYYFVGEERFREMIAEEAFLEWADVHGQLKGTSHAEVARLAAEGKDVLLEIDVQGAAQVMARLPDTVSIFVLPPSYQHLERRLRGRGLDSDSQIARRLSDAVGEIRGSEQYEYVIVNADLDRACEALAAVLRARRSRRDRMRPEIDRVLATLPDEAPTRPS